MTEARILAKFVVGNDGVSFKVDGTPAELAYTKSALTLDPETGIVLVGEHPLKPDTQLHLCLCPVDADAAKFMDVYAQLSLLWFTANRPDAVAAGMKEFTKAAK